MRNLIALGHQRSFIRGDIISKSGKPAPTSRTTHAPCCYKGEQPYYSERHHSSRDPAHHPQPATRAISSLLQESGLTWVSPKREAAPPGGGTAQGESTERYRSSRGASTDDDLHPAVLRLTHARTGGHQQVSVAEALDGDRALRHAILDQFRLHCLGAADRQALIVMRRA